MKPVPILIDTDPGVDDFFCIAIGCAFRELFDLKAITTIGGNNTTEVTTQNALNILKLLHRDDVPVAKGADSFLTRPFGRPVAKFHGANGLGNVELEKSDNDPVSLSACDMINYVGNVEGNQVPFGACNVLVTDGFTGNVFLKTMEGVGRLLLRSVKDIFMQNGLTKLSALMVKKSFAAMKKTYDPAEHGGAPFLGISKPVVKAHGSSDARAFKNAIFEAIRYAESDVIYDIAAAAERFSALRQAAREAEKSKNAEQRCEKQADSDETATKGED